MNDCTRCGLPASATWEREDGLTMHLCQACQDELTEWIRQDRVRTPLFSEQEQA